MTQIRGCKRLLICFAATLIAATVACGQDRAKTPSAAAAGDGHLAWAERLVREVAPNRNEYASQPSVVTWAGVDGAGETRNRSVCSTFVAALFERAYGYSADDMVGWLGSASPTAAEFYAEINASRGFARVDRVTNVAPGDIIAVLYPPGSRPTGHVMVADSAARLRSATAPIVPDTTQYEVDVIDSSSTGHGPSDTRSSGNGQFHSGVGKGTLRLFVDPSGTIVGYSWSTLAVSKFVAHAQRPVLVGRINNSFPAGQGRRGRVAVEHTDEDAETPGSASQP